MDSLTKSFKNHGSHKNVDEKPSNRQEKLPVLIGLEEDPRESIQPNSDRREVVVKIDGNREIEAAMGRKNKGWKGSYDFQNDGDGREKWKQKRGTSSEFSFQQQSSSDSSTKIIDQLQQMQDTTQTPHNLELEMHEILLEEDVRDRPSVSSKGLRVSFQSPSGNSIEIGPETIKRRPKSSWDEDGGNTNNYPDEEEVLKCTSNSSFIHKSTSLRSRTKSRLIDPPFEDDWIQSGRVSMTSGMKSGYLGKDDDDNDPFLDEDLPVEFKRGKLNALNILQWLSLITIVIAFICTLTVPFLTQFKAWNLPLWKWEVVVLVLICGRLLSGWGIRILVFFIERNFLLRKRVLYFVYALRRAVQNCLWLGLVLLAWTCVFNATDKEQIENNTLHYVTKILVCFLVGTLIWLVKTLLVKVLASSFHVSTYFDRIQDSLFNQYVIETLSGPPLVEIQHIKEEEERVMAEVKRLKNAGARVPDNLRAEVLPSKRIQPVQKSFKLTGIASKHLDEGITLEHLHKLNQKNVSAWNMKRLMRIVRRVKLSTLDEHIANVTGDDDAAVEIQSEYEAKAAAKRIFTNVAKHGTKYIYFEDLLRFMREDEALKTMGLFEGASETKRVNKISLKEWVVNAFRERRALSLTLNDTKTAVNRLHHMVNIIVGIIIVVISLLILGIATTQLLVVISSQVMLVVFMFGNTCKTIFEAIIFLFVMHPYDVGDRCEIEGVQMVVEEMNILTTVFLRYDNQKVIYPNSVLSTIHIGNFYRSPDMGDAIEFSIHLSTPVEKISLMRERIMGLIEGKKEHWYPNPMIVMKDVVEMNKLQFAVWLQHRMNHQNMGEKWSRRSYLVEEMIKVFRELDIEFRMLPVDVNLRSMPELTSSRFPSTWTTCA